MPHHTENSYMNTLNGKCGWKETGKKPRRSRNVLTLVQHILRLLILHFRLQCCLFYCARCRLLFSSLLSSSISHFFPSLRLFIYSALFSAVSIRLSALILYSVLGYWFFVYSASVEAQASSTLAIFSGTGEKYAGLVMIEARYRLSISEIWFAFENMTNANDIKDTLFSSAISIIPTLSRHLKWRGTTRNGYVCAHFIGFLFECDVSNKKHCCIPKTMAIWKRLV